MFNVYQTSQPNYCLRNDKFTEVIKVINCHGEKTFDYFYSKLFRSIRIQDKNVWPKFKQIKKLIINNINLYLTEFLKLFPKFDVKIYVNTYFIKAK